MCISLCGTFFRSLSLSLSINFSSCLPIYPSPSLIFLFPIQPSIPQAVFLTNESSTDQMLALLNGTLSHSSPIIEEMHRKPKRRTARSTNHHQQEREKAKTRKTEIEMLKGFSYHIEREDGSLRTEHGDGILQIAWNERVVFIKAG